MSRRRAHLLLLLLPLLSSPAAHAQPSRRIPAAKVESLAGDAIVLPDALRGKMGVLVLGFSRGSQQAVTEWGRRLAAEYRESPTVLYYEMPVLASVPRLVRGIVLRQIKSTVPERAWPRFAPLTEDEKSWRNLAHYTAADDAYILLVDSQGNVLWQTNGPATDAVFAALQQQVRTAATHVP